MPIATGRCFRQALSLSAHRGYILNITSYGQAGARPEGKNPLPSLPSLPPLARGHHAGSFASVQASGNSGTEPGAAVPQPPTAEEPPPGTTPIPPPGPGLEKSVNISLRVLT